jgi:hypothetical protein
MTNSRRVVPGEHGSPPAFGRGGVFRERLRGLGLLPVKVIFE